MRGLIQGWSVASTLIVCACSGTTASITDGGGTPCSRQTDCATDQSRVCESRSCSDVLPANDGYPLYLRLSNTVQGKAPKSVRLAVLDAVSPTGGAVHCSDFTSVAQVEDPSAYNLTAPLLEKAVNGSGDTVQMAVSLNAPSRLVYVELYQQSVQNLSEPGVTPVGVGCTEMPAMPLVACTGSNPTTCTSVIVDVGTPKS